MANDTTTIKAQEAPPMGKGGDCELSTLTMRGGLGCPPGDVVIQAPDLTELARIKPDGKVELHADTDEVARDFWEAIGAVRIAWACPELRDIHLVEAYRELRNYQKALWSVAEEVTSVVHTDDPGGMAQMVVEHVRWCGRRSTTRRCHRAQRDAVALADFIASSTGGVVGWPGFEAYAAETMGAAWRERIDGYRKAQGSET